MSAWSRPRLRLDTTHDANEDYFCVEASVGLGWVSLAVGAVLGGLLGWIVTS